MALDPLPIKIPPGMFRNGTEYESAGRWYDGNLVRWESGRLRPWGGWRRVLSGGATLTGKARAIKAWKDNRGYRYVVVGTNTKLYVGAGGTYSDITPNDLVTGRADGIEGPGYGAGPYGASHYGTQRTTGTVELDAATWDFDTWGQDILGVLNSDGRIFEWGPATVGDAAVVTNAPIDCTGVLVTDEEYVLALGAGGDRRKVQWCDQANNTVWTPSDTNTAGSVHLKTAGNIALGRIIGGVPLIWTNLDLHQLTYLGPPLVYGRNRIAENCGTVSQKAVAVLGHQAVWWGPGGFFSYDGTVRQIPCDVQDYVIGTDASPGYNRVQQSKIYASVNARQGEVTWFYPSTNSIENDRYVTYNLKGYFYFGTLARTCWEDRGVFQRPLAVDPDGVVWEQEYGFLADGATRVGSVFALSGPAELAGRTIFSSLMLPDSANGAAFTTTFKSREAPGAPEFTAGPYSMVPNARGYTGIRVQGRQISMRVDQTLDEDWSLGTPRFKVALGGGI